MWTWICHSWPTAGMGSSKRDKNLGSSSGYSISIPKQYRCRGRLLPYHTALPWSRSYQGTKERWWKTTNFSKCWASQRCGRCHAHPRLIHLSGPSEEWALFSRMRLSPPETRRSQSLSSSVLKVISQPTGSQISPLLISSRKTSIWSTLLTSPSRSNWISLKRSAKSIRHHQGGSHFTKAGMQA